jgi:deazaflavin-dependent oxidoreductase (nitroreductase family)
MTGVSQINPAERKGNLFLRSSTGGRILSALMLPHFAILPPKGFGVLTTTGRKTGKTRRKCVRAVRRGNEVYVVAIRSSAWLKNIEANPTVTLRIRGGTFAGVARTLRDAAERDKTIAAYAETVNPFDYMECVMWRRGRPARSKITQLHRTWFEHGTPLVIDLRA